ncbi:hypothetical protein ACFY5C_13665 [Streptomyces sp. NPDC012935]|uniref:hypothetical protein n=1 Tax=Streptomyces sp. NPDC012935 TaxID=3364857 RepID=UPI0036B3DCC7
MALALVRRRSRSETRGIGEVLEVELEVEVEVEVVVEVEVEVVVERVGAAIRGMGNFLGSRSDTAPSDAGGSNRRADSPLAATGGRAHASQVDVTTRREVPGLGDHALEASKTAHRCPDGDRRARRRTDG